MKLDEILKGFARGNRRVLARAITLAESSRSEDQELIASVLKALPGRESVALKLGVTGSPGAGKSTLIEALGQVLIAKGHRLAVLAVDPSSSLSGGSILGDKTRMPILSAHPDCYVRPSPTGGHQGGVARTTRLVMQLCEAFGFDSILVETVGVGQTEIEVAGMVDLFLLLLLPYAGDELQGSKKGIMEMADFIFINKADQAPEQASLLKSQCESALQFVINPRLQEEPAKVSTGSALETESVADLCESMISYFEGLKEMGSLHNRRGEQACLAFRQRLRESLLRRLMDKPCVAKELDLLEQKIGLNPGYVDDAIEEALATIIRASSKS